MVVMHGNPTTATAPQRTSTHLNRISTTSQAAIANPGSSEKAYSMITEVHCALVRTLVEEAFHAAVETETSINEDAKLRDVQHACPVVTVCWI